MSDDFAARVLAWVQEHEDDRASRLISVTGNGGDWHGSTDQGFFSVFGVDVTYELEGGRRQTISPEGSQMQSLWEAVVGNWYGSDDTSTEDA